MVVLYLNLCGILRDVFPIVLRETVELYCKLYLKNLIISSVIEFCVKRRRIVLSYLFQLPNFYCGVTIVSRELLTRKFREYNDIKYSFGTEIFYLVS